VSLSSVTAPLRARARPSTVAPLVTVIEVRARRLPVNTEPVPSVAELPTCVAQLFVQVVAAYLIIGTMF
jgi:hypothetical protein